MTIPSDRDRSPRVAQVIGSFRGGGAQRLAWNLAVGLAQTTQSFAVALKPNGVPAGTETLGDHAVEIGVPRAGVVGKLRALFALRRWLRAHSVELVHIHGSGTLPFVVLATLGLPIRRAFTWHDSSEVLTGSLGTRLLRRWALRRCHLLFGSSRDVAKRLAKASARPVDVWPNGVQVGEPNVADPARSPTIVWMGRFVPPKDPQALVRAGKALRDEGLEFRVIMLGDALPHLRWFHDQTLELIQSLGLGDRFQMPGWLDDPGETLRRADIAVQTSHTEGLSLALLEQMMAGLAIVATDVGDTNVAIEPDVSGVLIPKEDSDALVGALRSILATPGRAAELGRQARMRATKRFSVDSMTIFAMEQYTTEVGRARVRPRLAPS